MQDIALTFRYVVLFFQNENDTVQDELLQTLIPDRDIGIFSSSFFYFLKTIKIEETQETII